MQELVLKFENQYFEAIERFDTSFQLYDPEKMIKRILLDNCTCLTLCEIQ